MPYKYLWKYYSTHRMLSPIISHGGYRFLLKVFFILIFLFLSFLKSMKILKANGILEFPFYYLLVPPYVDILTCIRKRNK